MPYSTGIKNLYNLITKKPSYKTTFKNSTALHIRFGDYLKLKHIYTELSETYYAQALEELGSPESIVVFSDDINLAQQKLSTIKGYEFNFYNGNSDIDDFMAMTSCGSHIISNSSFAWWAAWLSRNDKVIMPKEWFTQDSNLSHSDLVYDGWIEI